ncbi:MAG: response regulator transcription factor [Pedobacter sp.]|nr:MAG: response regulator transcription factor [Pedobacter sp.]
MSTIVNIVSRSKHIFLYGILMAVLIFVLKWLQFKFLILDNSFDIYVGLIAVFFTVLGVGVAMHIGKPRVQTIVVEKEVYIHQADALDHSELIKLNLSKREYEILQLIVKGNSNAEIADKVFLSVSTVKTHVSNLFVKMDVKSRTQAIEKAKRLKITI